MMSSAGGEIGGKSGDLGVKGTCAVMYCCCRVRRCRLMTAAEGKKSPVMIRWETIFRGGRTTGGGEEKQTTQSHATPHSSPRLSPHAMNPPSERAREKTTARPPFSRCCNARSARGVLGRHGKSMSGSSWTYDSTAELTNYLEWRPLPAHLLRIPSRPRDRSLRTRQLERPRP